MAIQLNAQFNQFVQFAEQQMQAGNSKAIARDGGAVAGEGPLAGHSITAAAGDRVAPIYRRKVNQDANNIARSMFRQAVVDMFGGEDKIPDSVRDAMKMADYGKGKPLTARRILAVNAAIENLSVGSLELQDAFGTGDFVGDMEQRAKDAGHTEKDFKMLNTGANLLARATGMTLKAALFEVMDKSSAAYACASCGPLYTGSVADFKKGLAVQAKVIAIKNDSVEMSKNAATSGDAKDHANVAKARVDMLKIAKQQIQDAFAKQTVLDKTSDEYQNLMDEFDAAIAHFEKAAVDAEKGRIHSEKDLFDQIIGSKKMDDISSAVNNLKMAIHRRRTEGDEALMRAIGASISTVQDRCVTKVRDDGYSAFKEAFAEREAPRLETLLRDAEAKAGVRLPAQFHASIATNLQKGLFKGATALECMAKTLATQGAKVLFSPEQKARLKNVVAAQMGEADAAKITEGFAAEIEACCFQRAYANILGMLTGGEPDIANVKWVAPSIDELVSHFEKKPGLAKGFAIGFKEDRMDEVKADLRRVMIGNFNKAMQKDANEITSLKLGFMPQATREYNPGYVTFEGKNIPDGVTGKRFYMADHTSRNGLCEFLESKFDDNHLQMRRMVSFACGMADGLTGAINTGAFSGVGDNNPDLVKSPPRGSDFYLKECGALLKSAERDSRDNYDIRIDDKTGDVTIKLTHYESNTLSQYTDDKKKTIAFTNPAGGSPVMSTARFEVTMVIKNAPDAELGDNPPEFAITEIKQEVA